MVHQFRKPNFEIPKAWLKQLVIFDKHNLCDAAVVRTIDCAYFTIGS